MKLQRIHGLFKRKGSQGIKYGLPKCPRGDRGPRGLTGLPGVRGKKGTQETITGNVVIQDYLFGLAMSTTDSASRNYTVTFDRVLSSTPVIFTSPILYGNANSLYYIYINSYNYSDSACTGFNFTIVYSDSENNENYTNYDQPMNLNFYYIAIQI